LFVFNAESGRGDCGGYAGTWGTDLYLGGGGPASCSVTGVWAGESAAVASAARPLSGENQRQWCWPGSYAKGRPSARDRYSPRTPTIIPQPEAGPPVAWRRSAGRGAAFREFSPGGGTLRYGSLPRPRTSISRRGGAARARNSIRCGKTGTRPGSRRTSPNRGVSYGRAARARQSSRRRSGGGARRCGSRRTAWSWR
jgi:hypothetical protein